MFLFTGKCLSSYLSTVFDHLSVQYASQCFLAVVRKIIIAFNPTLFLKTIRTFSIPGLSQDGFKESATHLITLGLLMGVTHGLLEADRVRRVNSTSVAILARSMEPTCTEENRLLYIYSCWLCKKGDWALREIGQSYPFMMVHGISYRPTSDRYVSYFFYHLVWQQFHFS